MDQNSKEFQTLSRQTIQQGRGARGVFDTDKNAVTLHIL